MSKGLCETCKADCGDRDERVTECDEYDEDREVRLLFGNEVLEECRESEINPELIKIFKEEASGGEKRRDGSLRMPVQPGIGSIPVKSATTVPASKPLGVNCRECGGSGYELDTYQVPNGPCGRCHGTGAEPSGGGKGGITEEKRRLSKTGGHPDGGPSPPVSVSAPETPDGKTPRMMKGCGESKPTCSDRCQHVINHPKNHACPEVCSCGHSCVPLETPDEPWKWQRPYYAHEKGVLLNITVVDKAEANEKLEWFKKQLLGMPVGGVDYLNECIDDLEARLETEIFDHAHTLSLAMCEHEDNDALKVKLKRAENDVEVQRNTLVELRARLKEQLGELEYLNRDRGELAGTILDYKAKLSAATDAHISHRDTNEMYATRIRCLEAMVAAMRKELGTDHANNCACLNGGACNCEWGADIPVNHTEELEKCLTAEKKAVEYWKAQFEYNSERAVAGEKKISELEKKLARTMELMEDTRLSNDHWLAKFTEARMQKERLEEKLKESYQGADFVAAERVKELQAELATAMHNYKIEHDRAEQQTGRYICMKQLADSFEEKLEERDRELDEICKNADELEAKLTAAEAHGEKMMMDGVIEARKRIAELEAKLAAAEKRYDTAHEDWCRDCAENVTARRVAELEAEDKRLHGEIDKMGLFCRDVCSTGVRNAELEAKLAEAENFKEGIGPDAFKMTKMKERVVELEDGRRRLLKEMNGEIVAHSHDVRVRNERIEALEKQLAETLAKLAGAQLGKIVMNIINPFKPSKPAPPKRVRRVYVAGPYSCTDILTGLRNIREGIKMAEHLLSLGYSPFCPWLDHHFEFYGDHKVEDYYRYSMDFLECCDAVLTIGDWSKSKGVNAEVTRAHELGIPVFNSIADVENYKRETEKNGNA
jgi:hypothetical protein